MPTIIKLPNEGDSLTTRVIKCEVVESQKYKNRDGTPQEQVKFTTEDGDLYLLRSTADQKLGRIGFATDEGDAILYGDVDGQVLTFYRDHNKNDPSKPYWGIARAEGTKPVRGTPESPMPAKPATTPAKAAPASSDLLAERTALELMYKRAWHIAVAVQGKTATPESLQAGAATVFIAYQNRHLAALFAETPTGNPAPSPAPVRPASPAKPATPAKKPEPVPPPSDDDEPDFDGDDAAVEPDDELPF